MENLSKEIMLLSTDSNDAGFLAGFREARSRACELAKAWEEEVTPPTQTPQPASQSSQTESPTHSGQRQAPCL